MARNRKTQQQVVSPGFQAGEEQQAEQHNFQAPDAFTAHNQSEGQATSIAPEVADSLTVPPGTVQEIWESLREEFYERESSRSTYIVHK